jgi:nitrite reductase (NADH) small subunit
VTIATLGPLTGWTRVCPLERIVPDTGVAALVGDRQVAVFRLSDDEVHAIDNHDPCSDANVLARGIVGEADGAPFVASPVFKERFDLASGRCLDRDDLAVRVVPARLRDGHVEVAV